MDEVIGLVRATPRSLIGEYGCRDDPENPGLAAEWLRDAAEYGRSHNFVSMSYFNSGVQSPDGTWALQGETEAGLRRAAGLGLGGPARLTARYTPGGQAGGSISR